MSGENLVDWDQLDSISEDEANKRFLIEVYLESTRKDLRRLKIALDAGNSGDVMRLAHGGAGASGSYGMIGVVDAFRVLEKAAKEGRLTDAPAMLAQIEDDFRRLESELAAHGLRKAA